MAQQRNGFREAVLACPESRHSSKTARGNIRDFLHDYRAACSPRRFWGVSAGLIRPNRPSIVVVRPLMASSAADDARSQAVVQDAGGASPLQATAVTTTDGLAPSVSANGDERGSSAAGTDADLQVCTWHSASVRHHFRHCRQMLKNRTFSLTFGVDEDLVDGAVRVVQNGVRVPNSSH